MRNLLISFMILLLLISCNNNQESQSITDMAQPAKKLSDDYKDSIVKNSRSNDLLNNVNRDSLYKTGLKTIDTVKQKYGYEVMKEGMDPEKCNLFIGKYCLKKILSDSGLLCRFTQALSTKLITESQEQNDCSWQKMAAVQVYMNKNDYRDKLNSTSSIIDPTSPNGEASINHYPFDDYKK